MPVPRRLQTARIPPRRDPKLVDLILAAKRATEVGLYVSFPATVLTFDPTTQFVNVTPDFLEVVYTDDSEQVQEPGEIVSVPVQSPGASSGGYLTFPVKPGDKGLIHVTDRSLEQWLEDGEQRDPTLGHTHRQIDAVFVPNLRDQSRAIPSFDPTAAVLEETMIKLGASAVEAAVLGATFKSWADSFVLWTAEHTHLVPLPTPAMPTSTAPPTEEPLIPTVPPSILSTKVKIE